MRPRLIFLGAAAVWLSASLSAQQSTPIVFLGVAPDPSYTDADRKLAGQLANSLGRRIEYDSQPETYADLIGEVINRNNPFIARMTPYAYVSARMLGANVDAIATYVRRQPLATTYNVYFVVNAARFGKLPRTPEGVYEYIARGAQGPSRFVSRQQFSTSGYFLPALWMRSRHIFVADQDSKGVVRITASQLGTDPSDVKTVIDAIKTGVADFGAVWDAD
jgi:ABC-type phosphate/phosphonate transport system substrate-binding protein